MTKFDILNEVRAQMLIAGPLPDLPSDLQTHYYDLWQHDREIMRELNPNHTPTKRTRDPMGIYKTYIRLLDA